MTIYNEWTDISPVEKHLEVLVNESLNLSQQYVMHLHHRNPNIPWLYQKVKGDGYLLYSVLIRSYLKSEELCPDLGDISISET